MDNKKQAEDISSLQSQIKDLCERVETLENPEIQWNKGVNDKLSDYARKTVQNSRGPLKPDELVQHFTDDAFGKNKKESLAIFRKFSNNYNEVINQFSHICENVENHMNYRKKENEKDDKLIKRIRKFNKTVEEEKEKENKTDAKPKIQSTMDQFLNKKTQTVSGRIKKTSSKAGVAKPKAGKQKIRSKDADKENKKRKSRSEDEDDESCSSPEIEVEQVTGKFNKRFKLNSSQDSIDSNSLEESRVINKHMSPLVNIESSSEGSIQSDVTSSEEDSLEICTRMETDVKSAGKRSYEHNLRSKENAPEYNRNEETVHEKHLPLRGKQIR